MRTWRRWLTLARGSKKLCEHKHFPYANRTPEKVNSDCNPEKKFPVSSSGHGLALVLPAVPNAKYGRQVLTNSQSLHRLNTGTKGEHCHGEHRAQ